MTDSRKISSVILVAGLLASGCSSLQGDDELPQTVPADAARASEFPVEREWKQTVSWGSPTELWRSLYDLWQNTLAVCMLEYGFRYVPIEFVDDSVTWTYLNPLNETIAESWGYDVPDVEVRVPAENLDQGEAFNETLNGDNGCGRAASHFVLEDVVLGEFIDANETIGEAIYESVVGWESSPDGIALTEEWSQCMADAGLNFSSHVDAVEKYADGGASNEELTVRATDLECDREVGLTKTRSEYEQQQFADWLETNEDVVNDLVAKRSAAQARVTDLRARLSAEGADALDLSES